MKIYYTKYLHKHTKIITVEDGTIEGGFGSAVLEFMAKHNYTAEVKMLGIPDRIIEHGTLKELHAECGYDAEGIARYSKRIDERKREGESGFVGIKDKDEKRNG